MVFEQMLTILLGTSVGVAVVLYTVKPRHVGASQSLVSAVSSVETISLPAQSTSDSQSFSEQMTEVTTTTAAGQSPVVEAPVEVHSISSGTVSTLTAEVQVAGSNDEAIAPIEVPAVSAPAASVVTVAPRASPAARSHRAPRRSSASPRTHARSRAPGSGRATVKKRLDEATR